MYSSSNIIASEIESKVRWVGHVTWGRDEKCIQNVAQTTRRNETA